MNLVALDLPEEIKDWPGWLEKQVVGLKLRKLVQQLEIVGGTATRERPSRPNLSVILGDQRVALLASGLSCLNEAQLVSLVQNPRLLLELQEIVLEQGGEYWSNIERSVEHELLVENEKKWVTNSIIDSLKQTDAPKGIDITRRPVIDHNEEVETSFSSSRSRRWFVFAAALAAGLLIAVIPSLINEPGDGRFFARRNLLRPSLNDGEFLQRLAISVASDWDSKPENQDALKQQLIDFRDSCDVLLAADLSHLDNGVAVELKKRCQTWREKIDISINQLSANVPFIEVRNEANETIERLKKFLSELAA